MACLAQPVIELNMPSRALVDGEPLFVKVLITNTGKDAIDIAPPWIWNGRAVREQSLPFPLRLEVLRDSYWIEAWSGPWRRSRGGEFENWRPGSSGCPVTVRLWQGEQSVSWVELGWQYEIPPGRYRVFWRGPVFRTAESQDGFRLSGAYPGSAAGEPIYFEVAKAAGIEAEALALRPADRPGSYTPPWGDRSAWLALADPAKLAGTVYGRWADYVTVAYELAGAWSRGGWQGLGLRTRALVNQWTGQPLSYADHPMKSRIALLVEVVSLLAKARNDPAQRLAARGEINKVLAASTDHEWADALVRYAAWGDVPEVKAEDYERPADYSAALDQQRRLAWQTPARWGYPWFRLPPDQRPGGAAVKQEP